MGKPTDSVFAFAPPAPLALDMVGGAQFPVRRIYGVGKNYADHVAEMGGTASKDPPVFFDKPADMATQSALIAMPPATDNLHFEGELVIALGPDDSQTESGGGVCVYAYASGCDLTRRDLQHAAKTAGGPWDMAKGFDQSAPLGLLTRTAPAPDARLSTRVNGALRQDARLSDMILPVDDILRALGRLVRLCPGDLVFTGTPAGVGPLQVGDRVEVAIDGLPAHAFTIGEKEVG